MNVKKLTLSNTTLPLLATKLMCPLKTTTAFIFDLVIKSPFCIAIKFKWPHSISNSFHCLFNCKLLLSSWTNTQLKQLRLQK